MFNGVGHWQGGLRRKARAELKGCGQQRRGGVVQADEAVERDEVDLHTAAKHLDREALHRFERLAVGLLELLERQSDGGICNACVQGGALVLAGDADFTTHDIHHANKHDAQRRDEPEHGNEGDALLLCFLLSW